jgi:hypothetical protein
MTMSTCDYIARELPEGDGLRSTPRRLGHRDSEVFPEAAAAALRQRAPHTYWLRVGRHRVHIEHDYFFLPDDVARRIADLYLAYLDWWMAERPREFPRRGLGIGGFHDYCAVTVLREHAPWWVDLYREAATLCFDPWAREHAEVAR